MATIAYRTISRGTALAATGGLGYLVYKGLQQPLPQSLMEQRTQTRIRETFSSIAAGVAVTATTAMVAFRSKGFHRTIIPIMTKHPILCTIGGVVVMCSALMATVTTHKDNKLQKYALYGLFTGTMGVFIAPIGFVGGPIVMHAALCTTGLMGALGIVAATTPYERLSSWEGPAALGLGLVAGASLASLVFPSIGALYAISLYGGMAVFSGLALLDTAKMIEHAKTKKDKDYDPVNEGLSLYMDGMNLFIRIAEIMSKSKNNRR